MCEMGLSIGVAVWFSDVIGEMGGRGCVDASEGVKQGVCAIHILYMWILYERG